MDVTQMSGNRREFFITSKCNILLLHNGQSWIVNDLPITAILSSIDYLLFAWDQYMLIIYECRMADSDLPVIQWSPISAGFVLPTTSSTTHSSVIWFQTQCTSQGRCSTHLTCLLTCKPTKTYQYKAPYYYENPLKKPVRQAEKPKRSEWKQKELNEAIIWFTTMYNNAWAHDSLNLEGLTLRRYLLWSFKAALQASFGSTIPVTSLRSCHIAQKVKTTSDFCEHIVWGAHFFRWE